MNQPDGGDSLVVKRILDAKVDLVHVDAGGSWLILP